MAGWLGQAIEQVHCHSFAIKVERNHAVGNKVAYKNLNHVYVAVIKYRPGKVTRAAKKYIWDASKDI